MPSALRFPLLCPTAPTRFTIGLRIATHAIDGLDPEREQAPKQDRVVGSHLVVPTLAHLHIILYDFMS
jgi:hypothetical protein